MHFNRGGHAALFCGMDEIKAGITNVRLRLVVQARLFDGTR